MQCHPMRFDSRILKLYAPEGSGLQTYNANIDIDPIKSIIVQKRSEGPDG